MGNCASRQSEYDLKSLKVSGKKEEIEVENEIENEIENEENVKTKTTIPSEVNETGNKIETAIDQIKRKTEKSEQLNEDQNIKIEDADSSDDEQLETQKTQTTAVDQSSQVGSLKEIIVPLQRQSPRKSFRGLTAFVSQEIRNFSLTFVHGKLAFLKKHYLTICYLKSISMALLWATHVVVCFYRNPEILNWISSLFVCTSLVFLHLAIFYYFANKVDSSQKLTTLLISIPFLSVVWYFISIWLVQLLVDEGSRLFLWIAIPISGVHLFWILLISLAIKDITTQNAIREIQLSGLFRRALFITEVDVANRKVELLKVIIVDGILFVYTSIVVKENFLQSAFQQIVVLIFALNVFLLIAYALLTFCTQSPDYRATGEFLFCVCSWQLAYSRYNVGLFYFHVNNVALGIMYFIEMLYQVRITYLHCLCFINSVYGEELSTIDPKSSTAALELESGESQKLNRDQSIMSGQLLA